MISFRISVYYVGGGGVKNVLFFNQKKSFSQKLYRFLKIILAKKKKDNWTVMWDRFMYGNQVKSKYIDIAIDRCSAETDVDIEVDIILTL